MSVPTSAMVSVPLRAPRGKHDSHDGEERFDEAMERMHFAWRRVIGEPDRILAERGLGRVHHRVLYVVAHNPGLTVGELLEVLDVTKQALHRPLRELQNAGLLLASRDEGDRRVKCLRLTPEGHRYERRLAHEEHRVFEEAFERAGAGAVEGWQRVMSELGLGRRLRVSD